VPVFGKRFFDHLFHIARGFVYIYAGCLVCVKSDHPFGQPGFSGEVRMLLVAFGAFHDGCDIAKPYHFPLHAYAYVPDVRNARYLRVNRQGE
jgi:hypothetical protein